MEQILEFNLEDAENWEFNLKEADNLEISWQDEVELDIDAALMYIKSGETEIRGYVDTVVLPELSTVTEAHKAELERHVAEVNLPDIDNYVSAETKPEIDVYAAEKQAVMDAAAEAAQSSASAAAESAAAAQASEAVCTAVESRIGKPLNIKGTAASIADLPVSDNHEGDMYLVGTDADMDRWEYAWLDGHWEKIGSTTPVMPATETTAGIALIASAADIAAGVDNTKMVTPAKLKTVSDRKAEAADLSLHLCNGQNPHGVTKEQVGLGQADNTSDADKPVSAAVQSALDIKADKTEVQDLADVMLDTSRMTNCVTKVPQNIKMEFGVGIATIKAGSVVYVPAGFEADGSTPKFETVAVTADANGTRDDKQRLGILRKDGGGRGSFNVPLTTQCVAGTTVASGFTGWFYHTGENIVYYYNAGNRENGGWCLPFAQFSSEGGTPFNGWGYIGSLIFVLPGMHCLFPYGRNADGSLYNIKFVTDKVVTKIRAASSSEYIVHLELKENGSVEILPMFPQQIEEGCLPPVSPAVYDQWVDTETNYFRMWYENQWGIWKRCVIGRITMSGAVFTSIRPRFAARVPEWSDIARLAMPSDKKIANIFTSPATPTDQHYTVPADGYIAVHGKANNEIYYLYLYRNDLLVKMIRMTNGDYIADEIACKQGDLIKLRTNAGSMSLTFSYFIFAGGEV